MTFINCCFFVPIKTGVYLITILGLLNRLSGFYGVISLDYSDPIVFSAHLYSLLSLGGFAMGLFSIHNDEYKLIRKFTMFYWVDFIITTLTTIYFSIQWFVYTDHSLPNLNKELQQRHDIDFKNECMISIVVLSLFRLLHLYFAYVLTIYSRTVQYSILPADEEYSNKEKQDMQ